jgi:hypothetical protein
MPFVTISPIINSAALQACNYLSVHHTCRASSRSRCKSALAAAVQRVQPTRSKNAGSAAACTKPCATLSHPHFPANFST